MMLSYLINNTSLNPFSRGENEILSPGGDLGMDQIRRKKHASGNL
jgi:hypothetical protein